jgi:hypothetical protein
LGALLGDHEHRTENHLVTYPTPHVDARAAAVLIQILETEPAGISRRSLERRLLEKLEPRDLEEDSVPRLLRRVLGLTRDLGYRIRETRSGSTTTYTLVPKGTLRVLGLSSDQEALRRWIAAALEPYTREDFPLDLPSIIKQGIHARLTFRYGSTAEAIVGVAYELDMRDGRPIVLLETANGRRAYRIDAMYEIRMTPSGTLRRTSGAAVLVETDPLLGISDPRAARGRGRASREGAFLSALRIASLVRERSGESDDAHRHDVKATTIAEKLKLSLAEVTSLAELVSLVDRAVLFDETDPTFWIEPSDRQGSTRKMDGADALTARLQLAALTSLSGAQWHFLDIDPIDESEIAAYRSTLDEFLDRARIVDNVCPSAVAIAQAIRQREYVEVTLNGEQSTHALSPEGLVLRHWQWIVQGKLDGLDLAEGVPLSEIACTNAPD